MGKTLTIALETVFALTLIVGSIFAGMGNGSGTGVTPGTGMMGK